MVLTADSRAEEAARKAEAKKKRQRQLEVEEAERDAAEMADLVVSDPEVQCRFTGYRFVDAAVVILEVTRDFSVGRAVLVML